MPTAHSTFILAARNLLRKICERAMFREMSKYSQAVCTFFTSARSLGSWPHCRTMHVRGSFLCFHISKFYSLTITAKSGMSLSRHDKNWTFLSMHNLRWGKPLWKHNEYLQSEFHTKLEPLPEWLPTTFKTSQTQSTTSFIQIISISLLTRKSIAPLLHSQAWNCTAILLSWRNVCFCFQPRPPQQLWTGESPLIANVVDMLLLYLDRLL